MTPNSEALRRAIASDYDLIALDGVEFPTSRLHDDAIIRRLPQHSGLIVDAGCGIGALAVRLANYARRVLAVDISPESIRVARESHQADTIDFQVAAVEDLTEILGPSTCGAIVANRVLHHCCNLPEVVDGLMSLLEPEGQLIILDLDSTGQKNAWPKRALLSALYQGAVLFKGMYTRRLRATLCDLRREKTAYATRGWQQHLAHEPDYDWRDIHRALCNAKARFTRRRTNWRFHLFHATRGTTD